MILGGVWGGALPSIVYTAQASENSLANPKTFAGMSFGAENPTRFMLAGIGWYSTTATPPTVTIGGVTATLLVSALDGTQIRSGLFIASLPTGTSGSVVVSLGGTLTLTSAVLWSLTNVTSSTPYATSADNIDPITLNLNVDGLGVAAGFVIGNAGTLGAIGWTGLVLDVGVAINASNRFSGASYTATTAQTPLVCSATATGLGFRSGVAASFR